MPTRSSLAQIVARYPNDSRAQLLTRDICEDGFSQNDYAQARTCVTTRRARTGCP